VTRRAIEVTVGLFGTTLATSEATPFGRELKFEHAILPTSAVAEATFGYRAALDMNTIGGHVPDFASPVTVNPYRS